MNSVHNYAFLPRVPIYEYGSSIIDYTPVQTQLLYLSTLLFLLLDKVSLCCQSGLQLTIFQPHTPKELAPVSGSVSASLPILLCKVACDVLNRFSISQMNSLLKT